jgi:predicted ribosome quality control (RQC) complex YloA/Tae2 family protein
MHTHTFQKTQFIVGETAADNWAIIKAAAKDYYWVHLDKYPSAHVIIEIDVEPTQEELAFAAQLIRDATPKAPLKATAIWTQVSNLRLGSKPGEVHFKNNAMVHNIT